MCNTGCLGESLLAQNCNTSSQEAAAVSCTVDFTLYEFSILEAITLMLTGSSSSRNIEILHLHDL